MDHQNDNQSYSPYAAPTADTRLAPRVREAFFIPGGRSVSAGTAFSWISHSWRLFTQAPWTWIGYIIVLYGVCILLDYIPKVDDIIWICIQPFLIAGVVYSCHLLRKDGTFTFGNLFIGFQQKTGPLLIVSLIFFLLNVVVMILFFVLFGDAFSRIIASFITAAQLYGPGSATHHIPAILVEISIGVIFLLVGYTICGMAFWFAPALVIMHDIAPVAAIKMSFSACLKNLLPGIVFFITMPVLMLISAIPYYHLGLLVTVPMFFICFYTSYHSIFLDEEN